MSPKSIKPLAEDFAARAREYAASSKAPATRKAYETDWQDFSDWCGYHGVDVLPAAPTHVATYLAELADAGKKASTIGRRAAAITHAHKLAGLSTPIRSAEVQQALSGIRRQLGTAQFGKAPAITDDIRAMVDALPPDTLLGLRDRAIILLGFAGAFRRSELVALDVEDLEDAPQGLRVTLRRSKTDQEGAGRVVGIPHGTHEHTCPVRAIQAWQSAAGILSGSLFRGVNRHEQVLDRLSDKGVARAVKRAALGAGLDPARYSGHSLRAGLATSAAAAGVEERVIMKQTGHRSERTVRRYIRDGSLFRENAAKQVGL
ncbi:MAG: site-specific integrase [Armatimonadota bacterium]